MTVSPSAIFPRFAVNDLAPLSGVTCVNFLPLLLLEIVKASPLYESTSPLIVSVTEALELNPSDFTVSL